MILTQDSNEALFRIRAYLQGAITINENTYQRSLIISAQELITDWRPQSLQELTPEDWASVLALNPEVILLRTGQHFKMPPVSLFCPIYEKKVGIESMDTGAACRTYTALASEGRRVVAALLLA